MIDLIHKLIYRSAERTPHKLALRYKNDELTYAELYQQVEKIGLQYQQAGIKRHDRIAIYLEKSMEAVIAMFAASIADAVFVPVNPLLKCDQVKHILRDCGAKILVTSADRLSILAHAIDNLTDLKKIFVVGLSDSSENLHGKLIDWNHLISSACFKNEKIQNKNIDLDLAAILYTSGSTGHPKGVVLSHRNLLCGAQSVSEYLENDPEDKLLVVLPLSFDYGFSQLTTAFLVGATVVLMNYLLAQDVPTLVQQEKITGIAAVPSLWTQLMRVTWPAQTSLRYITNSGGAMHKATLTQLQTTFPSVKIFLMYGLTEAFRSTYLAPADVATHPDSIGKAIPGAEILVLDAEGKPCEPDVPGELVHRGAQVALGYWNDQEKTCERFRRLPHFVYGQVIEEMAVWSGDTVKVDKEGYFYFLGRRDDMIKVSGYRISPTEIEEVIEELDEVIEAAAIGVDDALFEQKIMLAVCVAEGSSLSLESAKLHCLRRLPNYMQPSHIIFFQNRLPANSNGKIDRQLIKRKFNELCQIGATPNFNEVPR